MRKDEGNPFLIVRKGGKWVPSIQEIQDYLNTYGYLPAVYAQELMRLYKDIKNERLPDPTEGDSK